ncbi:MAG: chromate efflux transporter [Anaerolineae bacterium]
MTTDQPAPATGGTVTEVISLFTRLGFTAFGGPAAHIAMLHDEVVKRRRWLSEQHFLDLLGATNLIPGPNSTEMCIHTGYIRAGLPGLIAAGVSFITPAMLMVMALAWAYVEYGSTPAAGWLLYGVQPVVIAVILQALWSLGQKALKGVLTAGVGVATLALYWLNVGVIPLLLAGGLLVMLWANRHRLRGSTVAGVMPLLGASLPVAVAAPFSLAGLFWVFFKVGATLYGSGYVLLAYLQADLVQNLGWLTGQQLLDAVAIGQLTPGPVFTTATFIGYLLGGVPGALVATAGIFLPSFVFVLLVNPWIPRLRNSLWAGSLLDGVNAAALGLMAAVTLQLGRVALVDALTVALALVAALLLIRYRVNSTWLIAGGALTGWLAGWLG